MTILYYQFTHGNNGLLHNGRFRTTITDFAFERLSAMIEIIKQVFYTAIGCCFIAIQKLSSSIHSCHDNPRRKLWTMIARKFSWIQSTFLLNQFFHCKQHKWWSYVKTFWVRLCLKALNFPMKMSDCNRPYKKYTRQATYLAPYVL